MSNLASSMNGSHNETAPLLQQGNGSIESMISQSESSATGRTLSGHELSKLRACPMILLFALLIFVQTSNVSLVTTISGSIAHDLDSFSSTSWFTSAYIIAMSTTTPLAGRLCKIFPPCHYIFVSGVIMAAGLLITAFAQTLAVFLTGRAIMGVGAGGCFSVAMILCVHYGKAKKRGTYLGILNCFFTIGVSAGASISGALESAIGWRAVFWIQIPVALVASFGLLLAVPENAGSDAKVPNEESWSEKLSRVDYPGIAALTLSVVLLLYSLSATTIHVMPIVLSVLGLFVFFACENYFASEPIVPIPILKCRGVLLTCLSTLLFMSARWTVLFYTPIYTIAVRGWSPAVGGTVLLPTNGGFAAGSLISGFFFVKSASSFYFSCLVVYGLFVITLYLLSVLSTETSPAIAYIVATGMNGILAGAALNYCLSHVLYLTPTPAHPIVISLVALFRGLGGSFGSAVGGGIFLRALERALKAGFDNEGVTGTDDLVQRLLGSPRLVHQLVGVEHQVARDGYSTAIRTLFLAGCALIILTLPLQAGTGWKTATIEGIQNTVEQQDQDDVQESEDH